MLYIVAARPGLRGLQIYAFPVIILPNDWQGAPCALRRRWLTAKLTRAVLSKNNHKKWHPRNCHSVGKMAKFVAQTMERRGEILPCLSRFVSQGRAIARQTPSVQAAFT